MPSYHPPSLISHAAPIERHMRFPLRRHVHDAAFVCPDPFRLQSGADRMRKVSAVTSPRPLTSGTSPLPDPRCMTTLPYQQYSDVRTKCPANANTGHFTEHRAIDPCPVSARPYQTLQAPRPQRRGNLQNRVPPPQPESLDNPCTEKA